MPDASEAVEQTSTSKNKSKNKNKQKKAMSIDEFQHGPAQPEAKGILFISHLGIPGY